MSELDRLRDIMARLRDPQLGCAWDRRQDFASVAPYTIEEAYEVADAIERGDLEDLCDELGDLLFQVVFHARMAEERGAFAFDDVVRAVCAKMVRRHVHVFQVEHRHATVEEIEGLWRTVKAREAEHRLATRGPPAPTPAPPAMPALARAQAHSRRHAGADVEDGQDAIEDPAAAESWMVDRVLELAALAERRGIDLEAAVQRRIAPPPASPVRWSTVAAETGPSTRRPAKP